MVGRIFRRIYTFLIFLFLYAPIIVLIVFSFNSSKSRGVWSGFTFKWYVELFKDVEVLKALYYTLLIAVLSSIISTIIGTFAAIGIYGMPGISKKIILNLNYLPVLNPDIVTAVSLMTLFRFLRIEFGFITMLLSHITFSIPYVILSILPKLKQMNKHLAEAAMDLGATPFYALRKVVIPEIMPGIVTGALLAFTLSVDDFVISFFNKGAGVTNLSITIFSMARRGINPVINALSTLMFAGLLVLLLIINSRSSKSISERGDII
ncbi:Spermidine/putrescine ABC transporter, permease protein 2 [[Clostridium] ultunense Esp]|uniref:Spermidine/putrescine ABC transporter, permease protein 2 n=1 Tax=[Clostridium] ultunense Esp TaxID=1288971 RepID=M1Z3F2_9FIRM|nr:ABC transporter permease [Schnuerera ultunensis]CCQ92566.1 Spermidine/putrescine ABC transporter, permease protein 2 [[Clostridium] ultunense Esp]SHD77743.1 Spermidine/putrescine ABC transporter, permease protein 2 [[Clostridium] ultunense Esp]